MDASCTPQALRRSVETRTSSLGSDFGGACIFSTFFPFVATVELAWSLFCDWLAFDDPFVRVLRAGMVLLVASFKPSIGSVEARFKLLEAADDEAEATIELCCCAICCCDVEGLATAAVAAVDGPAKRDEVLGIGRVGGRE